MGTQLGRCGRLTEKADPQIISPAATGDSPLKRLGEQDITASVNFTALIEYGSNYGFELVSYERQTAFLTRLGLIERIAGLIRVSRSRI